MKTIKITDREFKELCLLAQEARVPFVIERGFLLDNKGWHFAIRLNQVFGRELTKLAKRIKE